MANSNSSRGFGLGTILFVVFLILKLCGTIDWSWWWVTAPIWISIGLKLFIILTTMVFFPAEFKKGIKDAFKNDTPKNMNFNELMDDLGIDKEKFNEYK